MSLEAVEVRRHESSLAPGTVRLNCAARLCCPTVLPNWAACLAATADDGQSRAPAPVRTLERPQPRSPTRPGASPLLCPSHRPYLDDGVQPLQVAESRRLRQGPARFPAGCPGRSPVESGGHLLVR